MAKMNLVIVESPVKTKTIKSILATLGIEKEFDILGTNGHVCNLDENTFGVKLIDGVFIADSQPMKSKAHIIDRIKNKINEKIFMYTLDNDFK